MNWKDWVESNSIRYQSVFQSQKHIKVHTFNGIHLKIQDFAIQ